MYFPYFITYIVVGFVLSAVVFVWALRNGQFQEQQRARFLPLEERADGAAPVSATRWRRMEIYALFFLAGAGLLSSAAVLIFALVNAN